MKSDVCEHGVVFDSCVPCTDAHRRAEDEKGEVLKANYDKRLEKFLEKVPTYLHPFYDGSAPRGYYDKEKYRRTAAADITHTSLKEGQDPPQR
jgi:hypothetical protein